MTAPVQPSAPTYAAGLRTYSDMIESGATPAELTSSQAQSMRAWLENDFYAFAQLVGGVVSPPFPAPVEPTLHKPVCDYFAKWGQPGWRRLMLQLPRGGYKSSLITRVGPLWLICKDPNVTIAVFNEKVDRVNKWFLAIQSLVAHNAMLHALWPEVIPPGVRHNDTRTRPRDWKWSADSMNFNRTGSGIPEPTLSAMGVTAAAAGGHYDYIFWDDLLSDEAAASPAVMQSVCDWMDTAIYLGKSPELVNIFCCCTRWLYGDAYSYAMEKHNFNLYKRKAIEDGKSSFPALWTTEYLLKMQEENFYHFSSQMQNEPMASKEISFDTAWLRYGTLQDTEDHEPAFRIDDIHWDSTKTVVEDEHAEQLIRLHEMPKVLIVDPAATKRTEQRAEPRSRTAMLMRGIDWHGRRYMLDVWAGKETPEDQCRRMLRMLQQWGTNRLAVEEVTFGILYQPLLRHLARSEFNGMHFEYIALHPKGRDKDTRILGKAPDFQSGFEYVAHTAKHDFIDEYLAYPNSMNKDILDALAYDRDPGVLVRPESPLEGELRDEWEHNRVAQGGRYGLHDVSVPTYGWRQ